MTTVSLKLINLSNYPWHDAINFRNSSKPLSLQVYWALFPSNHSQPYIPGPNNNCQLRLEVIQCIGFNTNP